MIRARYAARSRFYLDERFQHWGLLQQFATPVHGWIKAIREALGLTTAQLASRLGVKQPSVVEIERSEEKATIKLATLQRVAEALDCRLVYALVPNKPLEATVRERARAFMRRRHGPVEHSMLLEDQTVSGTVQVDANLDEILRATNPSLFWD